MSIIILVKHSLPEIIPGLPAAEWRLSEEGRLLCQPLAELLAIHRPDAIVSSLEPKAQQTAQIVAEKMDLTFETCAGLHEHERRTVGFGTYDQFEESVARFFNSPGELVFGEETAEQARQRFSRAIFGLLAQRLTQNLVVVAHGTVITLFVAQTNGIEQFHFWRRLGLPSFVVLSLPEFKLLTVTESVFPASGT